MPGRSSGVVEGVSEDLKKTVCVLKSQPVHACASNPVPLRKVSGQVPVSRPYDGLLEQECLNLPLPQTVGGFSNGPEATQCCAGRYIPELTDTSKTRANPSVSTLSKEEDPPKNDSDSSESSLRCGIGRWRRSIPRSWKRPATPRVDVERGRCQKKLCDVQTQTDELEMHGLAELSEVAELLEDMSTATPGISSITESRVVLPPADEAGWPKLSLSCRKSLKW